jgi:ADP-heptose:LPS heptosyltransferase
MIKRLLIYNSGGGLGDALQILPLITTLRSEFSDAKIYYLSSHANHFDYALKDFNCNLETLDLDIKYFGFRLWHALVIKNIIKKKKIENFDLIIDLQSKLRNSVILKLLPCKNFISPCINFQLSKPRIYIKKNKRINTTIIEAINYLYNTNYLLKDFDINKIDKKFFTESERLLPKNNYVGFSITQGNVYRKKEWPINNIIECCKKLKEKNKIPVFLIEKKNNILKEKIKKLIPDALFPEHDSTLSSPALVTCLGTRLDFAITIDNGIMHMLSLAKVPLISLFGPTDSEKFAPKYKGSIVLDSKKIYATKKISSITSEDVLRAVKQHLNF